MAFTSDFILRGTRADQPTPPASPFAVVLYCVTDEGDKVERWNGTTWESYSPTGLGTVTTTGSPAAGELTQFSGADSITNGDLTGDVTTAGSLATTIANDAVTTAKIIDDAVTYAKMQNVSAASKLLGRGSASGAGNVEEITLGSGVSMSGTTLSASGSGGTVTTTGSPAAGELAQFSGASSITNGNLSGDVTTTDTLATTIANNAVSNAKLRDSGALSVIGRSANTSGDPADISATAATDAVLRESGSAIGFGTIATAGIANDAVTYAKIQNISAASKLLGRGSASGSGDTEEITLGTGLSMSGTTLSASGTGTVTTTGSPASGNLAKFSGATSITNADLTGDVTTSGGVAATIANDAVTYAKMQNVSAASKLLGRGSAGGSGDVEEITLGTGLTMSSTTISATGAGGRNPNDPTTSSYISDDFQVGAAANIGELRWATTGGTAVGFIISEANHPGIIEWGRASSGAAGFYFGAIAENVSLCLFADTFDNYHITRHFSTSNNTMRFGLFAIAADSTNQPANGIYFERLSTDTNWFGVCRASSTETRSDMSVAGSTSFKRFRIRRVDASTIGFSIDGGTEVTITTNIPTGAARYVVQVTSTSGAQALDTDFFDFLITGISR